MLDRVSAFNLTQNEICFQDQLNSLTPMSDEDRIFLLTISIQYQADK